VSAAASWVCLMASSARATSSQRPVCARTHVQSERDRTGPLLSALLHPKRGLHACALLASPSMPQYRLRSILLSRRSFARFAVPLLHLSQSEALILAHQIQPSRVQR
jgi:hypothetical protein